MRWGYWGKQRVWLGLARGKRSHEVWLGWGRAGRGSGGDGGGVEGGICPSPVSYSDTSFITGRKEAISVLGGEAAAAQGSGPACPPPPLICSRSQRDDGKSCWRGLSAPAGKGHSLKCSQVYTCHAYVYTRHMYLCTHVNIPPMHIYTSGTHTHVHIPTGVSSRDPPPVPTHQW